MGRLAQTLEGAKTHMPTFLRLAIQSACIGIIVTFTGCSSKPISDSDFANLQDPMPGKAIIYFLRAPRDSQEITVRINARPIAVLPLNSYTALSLEPGKYQIIGTGTGQNGNEQVLTNDLTVVVGDDERVIVMLSGIQGSQGFIPALVNSTSRIARGSREWKQVGDIDARSLIPVLHLVKPNYIN